MIIDLSAGAMRRQFVAGAANVWSFSFSGFGEAAAAVEYLFDTTFDVLFPPLTDKPRPQEKIWPYEKD